MERNMSLGPGYIQETYIDPLGNIPGLVTLTAGTVSTCVQIYGTLLGAETITWT